MKHHTHSELLERSTTFVEPLMGDSARLMQLVLRAESFGTWRVDVRSGQCSLSPQAYRIHGLDPTDGPVEIEQALRCYHPDDASTVAWLVQQAILNQKGYEFLMRLTGPDGQPRLVESIADVEVDGNGKTEAVFGVVRDLTERFSEKDRSLSRARLVKSIIQNSPVPIAVTDTAMRYIHVSPTWLAHLGINEETDVIGQCHYDVAPGVPDEWKREHEQALTGERIEREVTLDDADGGLTTDQGSSVFPWRMASGEIGGLILMVVPHGHDASSSGGALEQIASLLGG